MFKRKANKYKNQKVKIGEIEFDSRKEAERYCELRLLEKVGVISNLRRQVKFELAPSCRLVGDSRAKPALRYIADFVYEQNDVDIIEDVKSPVTRKEKAFRIKLHLMKTVHGLDVICI